MCLVGCARDLRSRAPADQDEHDDERDDQAVLGVDVADHELLEDPERIPANQREADGAEPAEYRRRETVDGDRDVRAVRHRVARRKQRAAERAESSRADERDDSERADVQSHELGGGTGVRAGHQRLADDRPAQKEGQRDRREQCHARDQHILRLDEDSADVPGAIGDAGIAARDVAELEQQQGLRKERGAERDDGAGKACRPAAKAHGNDGEDRCGERRNEDRDERRERERHVVGELEREKPAHHREHALREVDDARRAIYEHEAHADERERRSR